MVKQVIMPKQGHTMTEGTVVEWLKQEGDLVRRGEPLFSMESEKATLEVEATVDGYLRRILVAAGETTPVLTPVALVTDTPDEDISHHVTARPLKAAGGQASSSLSEKPIPAPSAAITEAPERALASPLARRLAQEKGIDINQVTGSGPRGRITKQDVLDYGESPSRSVEQDTWTPVVSVPAVQPVRGVRARIAERMAQAHQTTAPVTLTMEADCTALVAVRERLRSYLSEELGFDVGYNDLLIKLVARALRDLPYMNASLTDDGGGGVAIRQFEGVHIALAVDTERGLMVPVIRDADRKRLTDLAREVREVVGRTRDGSATPDELTGSSFTITNLGMFDVDAFTPIINLPEAAILGVGRIKQRAVVVDGEIAARPTMWLSLTFDHRLVDGGPAARFLQRIKQLLEEPYLLLA